MPYAQNGKQKPITERALKALEDATRAALEDAAPPDETWAAELAPQLVAIAIEHGVPGVVLIGWIRNGTPAQISGAAWRKAAAAIGAERRKP